MGGLAKRMKIIWYVAWPSFRGSTDLMFIKGHLEILLKD